MPFIVRIRTNSGSTPPSTLITTIFCVCVLLFRTNSGSTYRCNTIKNRGCLFIWRASEASETVLGVDNAKLGICYWRASVASETVLGVDNAKSGICYMYIICMWDGTYAL